MSPLVKLRAQQTLHSFSVNAVPVDPKFIAESLGLTVRIECFEGDLSGVLMRKNGKGIVAINALDSRTRQRFTIAHEIGHFVLEHKGDVFVDHTIMNRRDSRSSEAVDNQEIEANAFAAEILMPGELLAKETYRLLRAHPQIDQEAMLVALANKFDVSVQAMTYRLMNLGFIT